ncbi:MAG: hypothetical protein AAF266_04125 [Planctomycetota bacterium]
MNARSAQTAHLSLWAVLALSCVVGCDAGGVDVEGRVYFGDEPLTPVPGQTVRVVLEPEDAQQEPPQALAADLDDSGVFRFSDLTPGRYVAIVINYPGPQRGDRLAAAFANLPKPLVVDIDGTEAVAVRLPQEWGR